MTNQRRRRVVGCVQRHGNYEEPLIRHGRFTILTQGLLIRIYNNTPRLAPNTNDPASSVCPFTDEVIALSCPFTDEVIAGETVQQDVHPSVTHSSRRYRRVHEAQCLRVFAGLELM